MTVSQQQDRIAGLVRYLVQVSQSISPEVARDSFRAWFQLWDTSGQTLSVPDACPLPDGGMLLWWYTKGNYLEIEIKPECPIEVFYKNREYQTPTMLWEYDITGEIPPELIDKLELFRG